MIGNLCTMKAGFCKCLESLVFQVSLQPHFMNTEYIAVTFSVHIQKENKILNQINIPKQKSHCPDFSVYFSQVVWEGYSNNDMFNNHHMYNFLHFLNNWCNYNILNTLDNTHCHKILQSHAHFLLGQYRISVWCCDCKPVV